ncbi:MAG: S8 family serine peptidase, partial [Candidatus Eisenbacteria bacterium]
MPGPLRHVYRALGAFVFGALLLSAPADRAAATPRVLDLPLYDPAHGLTQTPAYQPRKFVLELEPAGPRLLTAAPPGIKGALAALAAAALSIRTSATGVAAIDALDSQFGVVALEPLFPGEAAPGPTSDLEDLTRFYVVHLPDGADLASALSAYEAAPGVRSAQPVAVMPVSYLPNDPGRVNQYQLGQANDRDSDVYEAWDVFKGDTTIVVAIVDTGVQYNHADLGGTTAPYTAGNEWTNFAELGGVPGVDDDGNGFVDDFRGWDFVNAVAGAVGEDLTTADNDPSDFVGHGTFCAGMASARTDNGVGIAGTAFKSKIMALRAGWDDGSPGGGGVVDMTWCAQAINYAVTKGANVINCSWSNNNLNALQVAVANAVAKGVTVCVAAGNDNSQSQASNYLSTRGDCVDVAATDNFDVKATFSNYGSWVDVAAAGVNVYSTYSSHYTPTYATGSGTSFSSPFVAGAVALFQGYRRSLALPLYSSTRMRLRLRDTGDNIDAINPGYAGALGSRLNVYRLLTDPPASWVDVLGGTVSTSPAFADLDGDGDDEVIVGASDGKLLALGAADGDTIPGWPVALASSINSNPAVWDVDQDGQPEIVVGTNAGKVWAVRGNGSTAVPGWPVQLTGGIYGGPAVGEVDPAVAGLECVVATDAGNVYVIDHNGAIRPGWPKHVNGTIYATPALHDFDGDGEAEIVVGAYDSTLYAWHGDGSAVAGWPIQVGAEIYSSAAIGDVDHDGAADVIVGCFNSKVYGFHANGTPLAGWPVTVAGSVRSSPALADLYGNDGLLEVAVASDGPTLYVIQGNGTFAPGWPQGIGGNVTGGVVVGNMDGDAGLELAVGAT